MEIIAGYVGEPHVTSQQERNTNIGIFGSNVYIIGSVNSELEATVVSANLVEISDGMIVCEGCTAEIPRGTNDSLVIENGEQGMKRIDLIVARYTKNGNTAAESMELAVIKGTSAANDPVAPAYNTGLIADGDSPVDFPIYRVNLNGISITSVDALVDTVSVPSMIEDAIGEYMTTRSLTVTYSWNRYCDPTSGGYAYKKNGWLFFRGNLTLTANMPYTATANVIGNISGWRGVLGCSQNIPAQNGSGVLAVGIDANGRITLGNFTQNEVSGPFRFTAAIPCENGYE